MTREVHDCLERFSLLASALSGRDLQVAAGSPNMPAWTDGRTIFLDANASSSERILALAVQASLLAAESLEPDIMRRLAWRPALARRYLAVEGHRALSVNQHLLPGSARMLVNREAAARVDSTAASLAMAMSRQPIAEPPASFGAIRARKILARMNRTEIAAAAQDHLPSRMPRRELAGMEGDEAGDNNGNINDSFSLGSGGAIGRLLRQALNVVRRIEGGSLPGTDMATHRARPGWRAGDTAVSSIVMSTVAENAIDGERRGKMYPEWDVRRQIYRHDWCSVREIAPVPQETAPAAASDDLGLRRSLARLVVSLDRCHRRTQGDDIDLDAAIEARVEVIAGSAPDEAVYVESIRSRRDLAVLLLLDISGSVGQPGTGGQTVHEQQRAVAAALMSALYEIGDRVALYAFHSQGRSAVDLVPVKRFDDAVDTLVMRRLQGLVPGAYSRLGAAIRHGTSVLKERGGTSRRLLVVLSDGLAYDHGYEPIYGAADARRALAETRNQGIGCLCLSIGAGTDTAVLQRVFGSAAHAIMPKAEHLSRQAGPLFRSALRAAEVRSASMKTARMMERAF